MTLKILGKNTTLYDALGKKISDTETGYKYIYDSRGYLVEDSDKTQISRYTYNSSGKLSKMVHQSWQNERWSFDYEKIYEYDNSGRLTKIRNEDSNKSNNEYYQYGYDAKGNLASVYRYDTPQNREIEVTYYNRYDDRGNLLEKTFFRGMTSVKTRYSYKFNTAGKITEETRTEYNPVNDSFIAQYTLKYDALGNRAEETEYENKSFNGTVKLVPVEITKWEYEFYQ